MEQFLFTYVIENELIKELATAERIANIIGCRDINESSEFHVYRVMRDGLYEVFPYDYPDLHCVDLKDRYGNFIESGYYPEH